MYNYKDKNYYEEIYKEMLTNYRQGKENKFEGLKNDNLSNKTKNTKQSNYIGNDLYNYCKKSKSEYLENNNENNKSKDIEESNEFITDDQCNYCDVCNYCDECKAEYNNCRENDLYCCSGHDLYKCCKKYIEEYCEKYLRKYGREVAEYWFNVLLCKCEKYCNTCCTQNYKKCLEECKKYCREAYKSCLEECKKYCKESYEECLEESKEYSEQLFAKCCRSTLSLLQATVVTQSLLSGNNIAFETTYSGGDNITAPSTIMYQLEGEHVYKVAITVTGSVAAPGFITILPEINGVQYPEYGTTNVNSTIQSTISNTSTFILSTENEDYLFLDFLILGNGLISNITGNISIIEIL